MNSFNDPIILALQMKAFKTNQFNKFKTLIKQIDPKAKVKLTTSHENKSLQTLCQSSTFFLECSSLSKLVSLVKKDAFTQLTFFEFEGTQLECIFLGGFYQNQALDWYQLKILLSSTDSKLKVLGCLSKTPQLSLLYGRVVWRFLSVVKASNGN